MGTGEVTGLLGDRLRGGADMSQTSLLSCPDPRVRTARMLLGFLTEGSLAIL